MALLPGIQPAKLTFGGHPGTAALGKAGGFRALQRLSLSSRLEARDVVLLHRAAAATALPATGANGPTGFCAGTARCLPPRRWTGPRRWPSRDADA